MSASVICRGINALPANSAWRGTNGRLGELEYNVGVSRLCRKLNLYKGTCV